MRGNFTSSDSKKKRGVYFFISHRMFYIAARIRQKSLSHFLFMCILFKTKLSH